MSDALQAKGAHAVPTRHDWPGMYEVNWYLARSEVTDLWKLVAKRALHELNNPKPLKLLTCHLTYYGGKRTEFYSPVISSIFTETALKPSHVLLLIDDVYDMYARLTCDDALFSPKTLLSRRFSRLKAEENIDINTLPLEHNIDICAQWQTAVMTQLLAWRHFESLTAERLARELNAKFLVWGTKQLVSSIVPWLTDISRTTYLSHPISRPRRMFRQTQEWPAVVEDFNGLQRAFIECGLTCIMPSAIDEYRIKQGDRPKGDSIVGPGKRRIPELEGRWPLPGTSEELLYCPIREGNYTQGPEHQDVLELRWWHKAESRLDKLTADISTISLERIDAVLRTLEQQIQFQISSRDHLFVALTDGLLVFRPLFTTGTFSDGVKAEINHWSVIAAAGHKNIVFVHFEEDVELLYRQYEHDANSKREKELYVQGNVISIICVEHGLSKTVANTVLTAIERDSPEELFDVAPIPTNVIAGVENNLADYRKRAEDAWLKQSLCFASAWILPESENLTQLVKQVVVPDMASLRKQYKEIADFLKG